jgi:hypothetical protein
VVCFGDGMVAETKASWRIYVVIRGSLHGRLAAQNVQNIQNVV